MTADHTWMREALDEARRAWGLTTPNPMVGAVVVRDGVAIGRGYHRRAGAAHAEPNALAAAGEAARGATLYVNLEPCSTWGRTPPCTAAIRHAGIARVVIANIDPNPKHAGAGVAELEAAGIAVTVGVEAEAAAELNKAFFRWITTGQPYVILKMAMTLDGRIATRDGSSRWITAPPARQRVQELRRWADAILVSGATVRLDRPQLTVREPADWPKPLRRLIATRSMTPAAALEFFPTGPVPECCAIEDWPQWLRAIGASGVTALLIEGGGELAAAALRGGAVDEVEFHIAPKILGGTHSRPVVGGDDPAGLDAALGLERLATFAIGDDLIYRARVKRTGGAGCSV